MLIFFGLGTYITSYSHIHSMYYVDRKPTCDSLTISYGSIPDSFSVIVTEDTAVARRFFSKYYLGITSDVFFGKAGLTLSQPGSRTVMWMYSWDENTLRHELIHVDCAVMREIGLSLSDATEEAYAYEYEYIYSKLTKH